MFELGLQDYKEIESHHHHSKELALVKPISKHYNHVFYPVLSHTAGCHVKLHQEGEAVESEFFSNGESVVDIITS